MSNTGICPIGLNISWVHMLRWVPVWHWKDTCLSPSLFSKIWIIFNNNIITYSTSNPFLPLPRLSYAITFYFFNHLTVCQSLWRIIMPLCHLNSPRNWILLWIPVSQMRNWDMVTSSDLLKIIKLRIRLVDKDSQLHFSDQKI